jgi:hypothetical protein
VFLWKLHVTSVTKDMKNVASCLKQVALYNTEMHVYSQNGEDGIIHSINSCVGTPTKFFVEFGVQSGEECNTRFLREHMGWKGLMMDGKNENMELNLRNEFITPRNIVNLFTKYQVPKNFDLLSVDTDGVDFHITDRILRAGYRPRVVVLEFNRNFSAHEAYAVLSGEIQEKNAQEYLKRKLDMGWDGTCYMGMSGKAAVRLMDYFGYQFITTDREGINIFFVLKSISGRIHNLTLDHYGFSLKKKLHSECSDRTWVDIDKVDLSNDTWYNNAPTIVLKQYFEEGVAYFTPVTK